MALKILLVQLRQLGDILLTTPCIREIKRAWPEASIDFLVHPMGRLILDGNPYLEQILSYDPKGSWRAEYQLLRTLRRRRYDLVLDFMYNPRSALYARSTGAKRRLAFESRRSVFFTEVVGRSTGVEYIVTEKFHYLRHLSIQPQSQALDLPWFEGDTRQIEAWLQQHPDFADAPLRVVLSPTHRRSERQWPAQRYAQLADALYSRWGARVVWIWGPGEEDFVRAVQALCLKPSLISPRTSFRELAALIAQCDLFVGNSNGPSHVAVAVDTPSLQIHGPTYAATWCPRNERHQAVQAGERSTEGRGPIDLITEEELWQALSRIQPQAMAAAELRQKQGKGMRNAWPGPVNFDIEGGSR